MKKLTIEINTENAAFDPDPGNELSRILCKLSVNIDSLAVGSPLRLFDIDGHAVGIATVE